MKVENQSRGVQRGQKQKRKEVEILKWKSGKQCAVEARASQGSGVWSLSHGLSLDSYFQLGLIFVMKLNKEPDPCADWTITQLMASLMDLVQQ